MTRADELAWSSVAHPVEGTILSVSRAAAGAATQAVERRRGPVMRSPPPRSRRPGRRWPRPRTSCPGSRRLASSTPAAPATCSSCESLERVVTGDVGAESFAGDDPLRRRAGWTQPVTPVRQGNDLEPGGPAYEVMYLLSDTTDDAVEVLKERLDGLGDSLLIVGTGDLHNVHVHVDDVGAAIEAGIAAGRPHRIKVTHFRDQLTRQPDSDAQAVVKLRGRRGPGRGVPVGRGGGGPERTAAAGQRGPVPRGGPLDRAGRVILLPNDGDTLLAANAAAKVAAEEGVDLRVVAARTAVQGIAALAVYDPDQSFADNVLAMSSAAAATRNGAVTVATKEALTSGGPCRPGDVLGVVDGDIVIVGDDLTRVGAEVVERLLSSGGELLTVVSGEEATPALGEDVAGAVRRHRRDLEVTQIYGGQPVYPLLLGVE